MFFEVIRGPSDSLKYSLKYPLKSYLMTTLKSTLKSQPALTIPESYQPILDPSDLSRPLKAKKKVTGGGWVVVKTKFIVWLRSKSLSFEFSELDFA